MSKAIASTGAIAIGILLTMSACSNDKTVSTSDTTAPSSRATQASGSSTGLADALRANKWALESTSTPKTATISFGEDGHVSGSGPCNSYTAKVEISGDTGIRFTERASTLMGCDDATMAAEQEFFAGLEAVTTADVTSPGRLVLSGEGVTLNFTALDASQSLTGEFSIVNINDGNALSSPVEGSKPKMTFGDDNSVSITGGCNTINASFTLDGDSITFTEAMSTQMACEDPGLMDQDAAVSAALAATKRVDLSPPSLMLLNDEGSITIVATRE